VLTTRWESLDESIRSSPIPNKARSRRRDARLVEQVYSALALSQPAGFQYATYRLADGVSFVHIASQNGDENPLTTLPEFAEFQRELATRITAPPVVSAATMVGSYGLSA
jgi:hypothetical protein